MLMPCPALQSAIGGIESRHTGHKGFASFSGPGSPTCRPAARRQLHCHSLFAKLFPPKAPAARQDLLDALAGSLQYTVLCSLDKVLRLLWQQAIA